MNDTLISNAFRRIALVGPDFFNYIQAVRDEFKSRGYQCFYYDERHSNSILTKIEYRLQLTSFLKRRRDRYLDGILSDILAKQVTDVFLIDTEVVTEEFVKELRSNGVRVHIYMWDSAKNKNAFLRLLPLLNGRSSFEPQDCEAYGMTYIPLFAENVFSAKNKKLPQRRDQLVFLGTLHSHRAQLLRNLEDAAEANGLRVYKFLYYHSKILYFIKCLRHPRAFRYFKQLQTSGFKKSEIADAYFKSRAVLDIHHPGQAGLTSRTFEALRAGAWLITLNRTVSSLPSELRDRVLLLSNVDELSSRLDQLQQDFPPLSSEMDYFLSLERFTDELLQVGGLQRRQLQ